jgi:antitoxin component of MazEF toxin-antitoxin module
MSNKTIISAHPNQRGSVILRSTIPRAIAQAMRLKKGDSVEWLFDKGDVVVRKS